MISGVREREIIQCACDTVKDAGFESLPVDPKTIASSFGITVFPWNAGKLGISGFLMKAGDKFGIGYSTAIGNEGFVNFTIAHELGHYFLSGHVEILFANGNEQHLSPSGFVSDNVQEREADLFAAELLMPEHLFKPALRQSGDRFQAIERLSTQGRTSIVATAIRYAKFADDPLAVLLSSGSQIEWCFLSSALRECRGVYNLGKRSFLPKESATNRFNRDLARIQRAEKVEDSCSLRDWFERAPDVEFQEDVVGLGHYGKTLTVLFTNEALEEEEQEDDDEETDNLPSSRWRRNDQSRH